MNKLRTLMLSTLTFSLVLVNSIGGVTPNCLGYFYEPEKPDLLK